MKPQAKFILILITIVFMQFSCKERFDAPVNASNQSVLVVEGVLNAGGSTNILLSRTTDLGVANKPKPELKALVTVESDANASYVLNETANGVYTTAQLPINALAKYRLKIKTANGKEYLSEYVEVNTSPPIDNVGWERANGGVQINVSASDPTNNTRYYRWETEETWQFYNDVRASIKIVPTTVAGAKRFTVEDIDPANYPYYNICWKSEKSSNIWLASTTALAKDVVSKSLLNYISSTEEKIAVRYSVLVKQYALSKKAYTYWSNLRKNVEDLGTLYSPQPSETVGNITCTTDTKEAVIGFFEVCNPTEKRIFISNSEVPNWNYVYSCKTIKVPSLTNNDLGDIFNRFIAVAWVNPNKNPADSIFAAIPVCVDCAVKGTPVKPAFWQ
ncbi:MAG TPA: DUF4249 domain-containing protein [Segetibacter sp.]|jgi:hypothetical protein